MPSVLLALQLLNSGRIGQLQHVTAVAHTPVPKVYWADKPHFARYGVLYDFFPHVIDLITWMLQAIPVKVLCREVGDGPQNSFVLLVQLMDFAGRCVLAVIDLGWSASTIARNLTFHGRTKDLVLDLQDQYCFIRSGLLTPIGRGRELVGRSLAVSRRVLRGRKSILYGSMIYHRDLLSEFLDAFLHNETPRTSLAEGLVHMTVIDAAIRSVDEGKEVNIDWAGLA
jgi:predicted dehydrogenase